MKVIQKICAASLFLVGSTVAHAGWLPERTIQSMHMTPNGNSIYVTLDAEIGYVDCPGAKIISMASTVNRFAEAYAALLRAQAAQTPIQVRDAYVDSVCNTSGTVVQQPYLRFMSQ